MKVKKDKFNVVLIALHDDYALGLRYISGMLKSKGFKVSIIFLQKWWGVGENETKLHITPLEKDELLKVLHKIQPNVIGVSLCTAIFPSAKDITKLIKKNYQSPVVWGGVHVTVAPEKCIEHADVLCLGEGEEAFLEVVQKLYLKESIDNIENLWVKKSSEYIQKNTLRNLVPRLDTLPFPDFEISDKYYIDEKNISSSFEKPLERYDLISSRGCPFSCTYCSSSLLRQVYQGKGPYLRRRSVSNVIAEIRQIKLRNNGLKYLSFQDDVFTFDKSWVEEFTERFLRENFNLKFWCYVHPNYVDSDIMLLLKKAGCVAVTMGIQSGSERILRKIFNRNTSKERILSSASILSQCRLEISYDFILNNMFETENEKYETLELLIELPRPFTLHLHSLNLFPGTKMTEIAKQQTVVSDSDIFPKSPKRFIVAFNSSKEVMSEIWNLLIALTQFKISTNRSWKEDIKCLILSIEKGKQIPNPIDDLSERNFCPIIHSYPTIVSKVEKLIKDDSSVAGHMVRIVDNLRCNRSLFEGQKNP